MKTHELANGQTIEYEATPDVERFLTRLRRIVDDPNQATANFVAVAFSKENPILNSDLRPTRGFVTEETLKDPAYQVVQDLLFRKEEGQRRIAEMSRRYTMTVSDAASQLGMTSSAVRKAVESGRLTAWQREGLTHLDPTEVSALNVGTRNPTRGARSGGKALDVSVGHEAGASLRIAGADLSGVSRVKGNVLHGAIDAGWREIVVVTGSDGGKKRGFRLRPSSSEEALEHGSFYVHGRFEIVEKANTPSRANEMWKAAQSSSSG